MATANAEENTPDYSTLDRKITRIGDSRGTGITLTLRAPLRKVALIAIGGGIAFLILNAVTVYLAVSAGTG